MKYFLGCDSHSAYSVIVSMDETGRASSPLRLDHSDEKGIEERETKRSRQAEARCHSAT